MSPSSFGEEKGDALALGRARWARLPGTKQTRFLGKSLPTSSIDHIRSPQRGARLEMEGVRPEKAGEGLGCHVLEPGAAPKPKPGFGAGYWRGDGLPASSYSPLSVGTVPLGASRCPHVPDGEFAR